MEFGCEWSSSNIWARYALYFAYFFVALLEDYWEGISEMSLHSLFINSYKGKAKAVKGCKL